MRGSANMFMFRIFASPPAERATNMAKRTCHRSGSTFVLPYFESTRLSFVAVVLTVPQANAHHKGTRPPIPSTLIRYVLLRGSARRHDMRNEGKGMCLKP